VYGAAITREAATRGLRAVLIEQNDFCSGASANSLKIIHGGLRYLQQMDLPRVFESIRERSILLRTAPHLVDPLSCIMPTRPTLMKSRLILSLGTALNDMLSAGRNRGLDPSRRLAACRTLSKAACLERLPGLRDAGITGGAIWHDAMGYDTERIVISMIMDACDAGAMAANYVKARELIVEDGTVVGVRAEDVLSGETLMIRSQLVINAAGTWSSELLGQSSAAFTHPCRHLVLGINLILKRGPSAQMAAGLTAGAGTPSGGRLFFFVPWRGVTMAGTYYRPHEGSVDSAAVTDADIEAYLAALNSCYPGLVLTRDDILMMHAGVIPGTRVAQAGEEPPLLRHFRLVDHANTDGVEGLLTVLGVKYTTARDVAQRTMSLAIKRLDGPVVRSTTAVRPLPGDVMGNVADFREAALKRYAAHSAPVVERLLRLYGCGIDALLGGQAVEPVLAGSDDVLAAEIRHVIANEMPLTLADLIFRRTGIGSSGQPNPLLLHACAALMAEAYGWDTSRREAEVEAVIETRCLWNAGVLGRK